MPWAFATLQLAPQKFDKLTSTCGHIFSYARQSPYIKNFIFLIFMGRNYCGHFKAITDEQLSKIKFLARFWGF